MFQGKSPVLVDLLRLTVERLHEDTISGLDAQLARRIVGWVCFSDGAMLCLTFTYLPIGLGLMTIGALLQIAAAVG